MMKGFPSGRRGRRSPSAGIVRRMASTPVSGVAMQDQQYAATEFPETSRHVMWVKVNTPKFLRCGLPQGPKVSLHDGLELRPEQAGDLIQEGVQRVDLAMVGDPPVKVRHLDHEE
eukprot:Pompholyxophrys_punicea_v1_NODE_6_length_8794_cov_7.233894.p10 type:complete len:115 gc:universal NODE_6_length_8794_cov_7.233894:6362-6706(+)